MFRAPDLRSPCSGCSRSRMPWSAQRTTGGPRHPHDLAAALAPAPAGARAQRPAGLPPGLRLLPQPEELGRLQHVRDDSPAGLGAVAVRRAQSRPTCCTRSSGSTHAAYVLVVVYKSFTTSCRCRWWPPGVRGPDPRGLRLPHLRDVGVGPGGWLLLPDPDARPVRRAPERLRRARAHRDHHHPGAVPRRARAPAHRPGAATPSPASRRSPACTWRSRAWCADAALLRPGSLARVLAVYLVATMVATVYFGWHFVVDDIAGVLLALAGRALRPPDDPPPGPAVSLDERVPARVSPPPDRTGGRGWTRLAVHPVLAARCRGRPAPALVVAAREQRRRHRRAGRVGRVRARPPGLRVQPGLVRRHAPGLVQRRLAVSDGAPRRPHDDDGRRHALRGAARAGAGPQPGRSRGRCGRRSTARSRFALQRGLRPGDLRARRDVRARRGGGRLRVAAPVASPTARHRCRGVRWPRCSPRSPPPRARSRASSSGSWPPALWLWTGGGRRVRARRPAGRRGARCPPGCSRSPVSSRWSLDSAILPVARRRRGPGCSSPSAVAHGAPRRRRCTSRRVAVTWLVPSQIGTNVSPPGPALRRRGAGRRAPAPPPPAAPGRTAGCRRRGRSRAAGLRDRDLVDVAGRHRGPGRDHHGPARGLGDRRRPAGRPARGRGAGLGRVEVVPSRSHREAVRARAVRQPGPRLEPAGGRRAQPDLLRRHPADRPGVPRLAGPLGGALRGAADRPAGRGGRGGGRAGGGRAELPGRGVGERELAAVRGPRPGAAGRPAGAGDPLRRRAGGRSTCRGPATSWCGSRTRRG